MFISLRSSVVFSSAGASSESVITAYCGYTELKQSRRVIGGKDQALKDFASFFENVPMLYYPLDQVKQTDLWRLVYHFLSSDGAVKLH